MAKNSPNWNILIVGAVIIGGLYFYNKIKNSPSPNAAIDYVSGVSGQNISDATQPTIRTDLRQAARTQRTALRNPVAEDYTSGVTGALISDASQGTVQTDLRQTASIIKAANRQNTRIILAENRQSAAVEKVELRQEGRTTRALNRQASRQAIVNKIVSAVVKPGQTNTPTSQGLPMSSLSNPTTPIYNANTIYTRLPASSINPYMRA